jgi:hypothetical protein
MVTPLTVVQAQAIAAIRDEKPQESLHQIQQIVLICIYISIDFIIILTFHRNFYFCKEIEDYILGFGSLH